MTNEKESAGLYIVGKVQRVRRWEPADRPPVSFIEVDVHGFENLSVRADDSEWDKDTVAALAGRQVVLSVVPSVFDRRVNYTLRGIQGTFAGFNPAPTAPASADRRAAAGAA